MKSIITFFSEFWSKKEEPIQLYKKEEVSEEVVEVIVVQEKEEVSEEVKEEVSEEVKEEVSEEDKEEVSEEVKQDKYILKLKNPNNYTSFNKNDSSDDDDIEKCDLKEKRKLDEILEQIILDTVVTECYFTSED